ncbi:MAG: glycosyltransferase [Betaproteobacteria bacterium]|nr:glycosyltransferase [Betaproteobacteria bacterium]
MSQSTVPNTQSSDNLRSIPSSASIYFHPEAFSTTGPKLMGRNSAGESFMRGLLMYSSIAELSACLPKPAYEANFRQLLDQSGYRGKASSFLLENLASRNNIGTIFYPGPGLAAQAWARHHISDQAWSLCGITHTLASSAAMHAITECISAPVQPWDALICTSKVAHDVVHRLFEAHAAYLESRLGAKSFTLPQTPIIPLGVHSDEWHRSSAQTLSAREALNISADACVVLFAGRLSFHAKAHPLAMYRALELALQELKAAQTPDRVTAPVVLIEAGVFPNDAIARAFADAFALAAPSVRRLVIEGRQPLAWDQAWASADIFCSLSDNIQETFGITPLEAMARGLPVIISDWNGYRDHVVDAVHGYRISTIQPPPGQGADLGLRYSLDIDTYDMYIGHAAMIASVDVRAACQAFKTLIQSPEKRQAMGAAAKAYVQANVDWRVIIPRYEALWADLDERRSQAATARSSAQSHAQNADHFASHHDPMTIFASYPTRPMDAQILVSLGSMAWPQVKSLAMLQFAQAVLPAESLVQAILGQLQGARELSLAELANNLGHQDLKTLYRALAVLAKVDVLRWRESGALHQANTASGQVQ